MMDAHEVLAVYDSLIDAGISVGISGGWGVDALLGRQTRRHGDVDLALDAERIEAAIEALARLGYALSVDQRPARLELAKAVGQRVDLHPVRWQDDGTGYQDGFDDEVFVYPPGSMDFIGRIANQEVRCASPQLQMAFHTGYEAKEHDRRDVALLAAAFGLEPPAG